MNEKGSAQSVVAVKELRNFITLQRTIHFAIPVLPAKLPAFCLEWNLIPLSLSYFQPVDITTNKQKKRPGLNLDTNSDKAIIR